MSSAGRAAYARFAEARAGVEAAAAEKASTEDASKAQPLVSSKSYESTAALAGLTETGAKLKSDFADLRKEFKASDLRRADEAEDKRSDRLQRSDEAREDRFSLRRAEDEERATRGGFGREEDAAFGFGARGGFGAERDAPRLAFAQATRAYERASTLGGEAREAA